MNDTLNLSFQQLLEIQHPDSDVVKSKKVLFCYLLPLEKYIKMEGYEEDYVATMSKKDPKWFYEYISCWSIREGSNRNISTLKSKKYEYIMFFAKEQKATSYARFVGCYKNGGVAEEECILDGEKCVRFAFEKVHDFDDLDGHVVIKWPESDRSILEYWCKGGDTKNGAVQHKYIYRINDLAIPKKDFTRYEDVILSFSELKGIIDAGKITETEWRKRLSIVKGIYCIVDKTDGKMYVGAAYGEEGIWGRWQQYVETDGHGDNVKMKEILMEDMQNNNEMLKIDEARRDNLQWSILEIFSQSKSNETVLSRERFYKDKFCTIKIQLNEN